MEDLLRRTLFGTFASALFFSAEQTVAFIEQKGQSEAVFGKMFAVAAQAKLTYERKLFAIGLTSLLTLERAP